MGQHVWVPHPLQKQASLMIWTRTRLQGTSRGSGPKCNCTLRIPSSFATVGIAISGTDFLGLWPCGIPRVPMSLVLNHIQNCLLNHLLETENERETMGPTQPG
ncbi:hypothetical protein XELAEV_18006312mg [Xenopus laevis]|uniref:Uncharacterized protein n=1 Tax=Xenopus laevis TaxID=8355 RepID=A0A974I437_XENLA|nr:hypothetical protein XELAEV_18006312mg [Xenopus laevis]